MADFLEAVDSDGGPKEPTPVTLVSGGAEVAVGSAFGDVIDITPTLDTSAYADGDVLFDFTEAANFVRVVGGRALIQSITVVDKADQGIAFDLLSSRTGGTLGTANSTSSISDANAANVQRITRIESGDYIDLGGARVATRTNIGLMIETAADTRSMWIGAITRGAPTYSADSLVIRLGLIWF